MLFCVSGELCVSGVLLCISSVLFCVSGVLSLIAGYFVLVVCYFMLVMCWSGHQWCVLLIMCGYVSGVCVCVVCVVCVVYVNDVLLDICKKDVLVGSE